MDIYDPQMQVIHDSITIKTADPIGFIEITEKVRDAVKRSNIKDGIVTLTTQHTTTALCVNERCERLQEDMKELLTRFIPPGANYKHDHGTVDGRNNAHSHLMSLFLKTTEMVPVSKGKIEIGTWQSIFFIELDGPRAERNISVTIIGNDK